MLEPNKLLHHDKNRTWSPRNDLNESLLKPVDSPLALQEFYG